MAVTFPCTHCKKVLRSAAPPPAGKKVKCPACGGLFLPAFKDPDETESTAVSAKPSPKPALAKSKAEAAAPPKKRRDDDETEVIAPKKKRPVADMDEDDDDRPRKKRRDEDDDDAPRSRKGRRDEEDAEDDDRPRKGKKKSGGGMGLILALAGGGVGLLLIFGLTAYVWPGFLTSKGGGGGAGGAPVGGVDPMSLVAKDSNAVAVIQVKKLGTNAMVDALRKTAMQGGPNNEDAKIAEMMLDAERIVVGGSTAGKRFNAILVFAAPVNADVIRQKLKVGPVLAVNGQSFYRQEGDPNGGLLAFPTDRIVCVANGMTDQDFATLLAGKGNRSNLAPDLQVLLAAQANGEVTFATTIDNEMRNAVPPPKKGGGGMAFPGVDDLSEVMKKAKGVGGSFAMQNGGMQINIALACDNPADATKAQKALEGLKSMIPFAAAMLGGGGKGGPQMTNILGDVGKMQFQAQGENCTASLAFSQAAMNEMEALANQAGKAPPGGIPPGGFVPPGGVRPPGGIAPPAGIVPPGGVRPPNVPPFPKKR